MLLPPHTSCFRRMFFVGYTPVMFNTAMENSPFSSMIYLSKKKLELPEGITTNLLTSMNIQCVSSLSIPSEWNKPILLDHYPSHIIHIHLHIIHHYLSIIHYFYGSSNFYGPQKMVPFVSTESSLVKIAHFWAPLTMARGLAQHLRPDLVGTRQGSNLENQGPPVAGSSR